MISTIPELEKRLQNNKQWLEQYYNCTDPSSDDSEFFGYCKASVEYIPLLITLLKLDEARVASIQNDDLWQEIEQLKSKIATLEAINTKRDQVFPSEIKDTHYHRPDPRLVFEDYFC